MNKENQYNLTDSLFTFDFSSDNEQESLIVTGEDISMAKIQKMLNRIKE